jgi:homoaconitase/3-isopropylmalate dehydratase large subunit
VVQAHTKMDINLATIQELTTLELDESSLSQTDQAQANTDMNKRMVLSDSAIQRGTGEIILAD